MLQNFELKEMIQCLKWYYGGQSVQNILELHTSNFFNQPTEHKIKKWILQFETNGCLNPLHYAQDVDECVIDNIPDKFCCSEIAESHFQQKDIEVTVKQEYFDSESYLECHNNLNNECNKNAEKEIQKENSASSEVETHPPVDVNPNENERPTKPQIRKRRLICCLFCKKKLLNFARHLRRHHANEPKVRQIFSYPIGSVERRNHLTRFRNKSNFLSGNDSPVCSSRPNSRRYATCPNCLGLYSYKRLAVHRRMCLKRCEISGISSDVFKTLDNAQNAVGSHLEMLQSSIMQRMRPDIVSRIVKSDPLICEMGAQNLRYKIDNKYTQRMTTNKMRELAKLLLQIREKKQEFNQLIDILQPEYYDLFVEATRTLSKYNKQTNCYETPTFAISIGPSLKQCCQIALDDLSKYPSTSVFTENHLKNFIELLKTKWKKDITEPAYKSINSKRVKEPVKLDSDDIEKKLTEIAPLQIGDLKINILKSPIKDRKRVLIPWTQEQKLVVEKFFQNHIERKKPPTQAECEFLKIQFPKLLSNKDWMKIKVFIQNKYTNKLK